MNFFYSFLYGNRTEDEKAADQAGKDEISRKRIEVLNGTMKGKQFATGGQLYTFSHTFEEPYVDENGNEVVDVWAKDENGEEVELTVPVSDLKEQALSQEEQKDLEEKQDDASEAVAEKSEGAPKDFRGGLLPMKFDAEGKKVVDADALWNNDPEAYLRWNDSQNGGDTEDSREMLSAVIAKREAEKQALKERKKAETVPSVRQNLQTQIANLDAQISMYGGFLAEYEEEARKAEVARQEEQNIEAEQNAVNSEQTEQTSAQKSEDEGTEESEVSERNAVAEQETSAKEDDTPRPLRAESTRSAESEKEESSSANSSLLDVIHTLYTKGKEYASKIFQRSFFDVVETPEFMKQYGLTGSKFTIRYGVITRHWGKDESHNLTEQEWSKLPEALRNPFAITKLKDEESGYRIYTSLQNAKGEYVVVGVDVKNAGRDIEVNAISTVFGRKTDAGLTTNEEVVYRSEKITPEQSSLLGQPNSDQYPTEQESSSASEDKQTSEENKTSFADEMFADTLSNAPEELKGRITVRESSTGDEQEENFVQSYDIDGKPSGISRIELFDTKSNEDSTRFVIDGSDVDAASSEQDKWESLAREYHKTNPDVKLYISDESGIGFSTFKDAYEFRNWAETRQQETSDASEAKLAEKSHKAEGRISAVSQGESVLRDVVISKLRNAGIEVIDDVAEGQKILDEANSKVQARESRSKNPQSTQGQNESGKDTPNVRYFRTANGEAYGFTVGGKIYIDPRIATSETPIHEYAHLWATAIRRSNPKEWENIISLMKGTEIWEKVKRLYPGLKTDSEIADEVLAHYSGSRGAERLREAAEKIMESKDSVLKQAEALSAIQRVKDAIAKFWKNVCDFLHLHCTSAEEVADRVMTDLLSEINPRKVSARDSALQSKDNKTLAGVHNISEEKLSKAIKQGGLANPSVAVIDTDTQRHEEYGDISLIMPSSMIDKRTGKNAGTWQGDAWTPTYPQIERQMSREGTEKADNDVLSVPKEMQSQVKMGIDRYLDSGELNSGLAYLFLYERGKAPEIKAKQHQYSDKVYDELKFITAGDFSIDGIGKADTEKVLSMYIDAKYNGNKAAYEERVNKWAKKNKEILDQGKTSTSLYSIAEKNVDNYEKYGFNYDAVQRFATEVQYDHRRNGADETATLKEADEYIESNNLEGEFNAWIEDKEKQYGVKEVIFDGYTPSGKRRYVPNTLENVSKLMKKQGRNGATGLSVSFPNFVASVMSSYGSLKEIRSHKGLLTSNREAFDAFRDKWQEVFYELGMKCQPDATGTFDNYGLARLSEAAQESDPQAYLKKEYNVDFSDEDTKRLKEMVKAIKEKHPAMYFETKFERPVSLGEFSAAVVPTSASAEIKRALQDVGVSVFEYDKNKEEDRKRAFDEAVSSRDDIRFQENEEMAGIVASAKADGTYMKAPNGKPSNLNERQWAQVRTKAFKKWFGDWEKAARIESLRVSEPVEITGDEYKGKYDLTRDSAKSWIKDNLRGEYTNKDTKERIEVRKDGAQKVTSHSMGNEAHLKSLVAIPELIERSIFIEERPNEKDNLKYDSYRYYVCGLKIGETNYTVKITVGVKGGSKYYDHALTEIEKGSLLDNIDALSTTFDAKETSKGFGSTPGTNPTTLAISKDSKLLSILQNNSSKVVDENGEPRVVFHGTPNDFTVFDKDYLQTTSGDKGNFGSGFYFTPRATVADFYARFKGGNGFVIDGFLNLMNPFVIEDHSYEEILRYIREDYSRELADGMSRIKDRSSQASVMIIDSHSEETFSKNLSEAGYDGIIARRGEQIIAFSSNQIKSATDNVGRFDTENDDIRYQLFGGNSGYVGYSMSRRAAQAREDGKFPKTDFKKEYKVKEDSLKALVDAKVIDDSEWHHTSMYGNRTTFYQWDEPEYADIYAENKKEIDAMIANKEKELKAKIANLQEQLDAMPKERPYRYEMESDEFRNAKRRIERETSAKTQEINDSYNTYQESREQHAERMSRLEAAWAEREARIKELEENASESDKVIIAHSKANDEYYRKSGKLIAVIQDARRDHDDEFRKRLSDYFVSRYEAIEAQRKAEAEAKAKLDAVNAQFNGKLDSLIADPTQKDRVLSLGQSGNFLVRGGIADAEIRLDYDKLVRKSKESYKNAHPFDSSDVKNLPRAINAPIAVFNNTNDLDAGQVILTEIKRGDHNFIVAVQTKQEHRKGGVIIEVNDISTLFPKNAKGIINWFIQGKATNIDKEKALHFIEALPNHLETTITSEELSSETKVVESFENPTVAEKNVANEDNTIQYSIVDEGMPDSGSSEATEILDDVKSNGLSARMSEEQSDDLLLDLYQEVSESTRRKVTDRAMKNGFSFPKAMASYIADMDTDNLSNEDKACLTKARDAIKKGLLIDTGNTNSGLSLKDTQWIMYQTAHAGERGIFAEADRIENAERLGHTEADEAERRQLDNGVIVDRADDRISDDAAGMCRCGLTGCL